MNARALFLAAALFSCAHEPPAATMDPNERSILDGASITSGDLKIGAGNFWEDGGQLTCALSLSSPYRTERVRKGQVLEHAGRRIEVADVTRDRDGKGVVVLKLSPP